MYIVILGENEKYYGPFASEYEAYAWIGQSRFDARIVEVAKPWAWQGDPKDKEMRCVAEC